MNVGLLLTCFILPGVNSRVTLSSAPVNYEDAPNCSRVTDFASDKGIHEISSAMEPENTQTVWLPMKRIQYDSWKWRDGSIYPEAVSTPDKTNAGHDCAWLRAGDKIIDDGPCNRTLSLFVCDTTDVACPDIPESYKCFTIRQKTYAIFSKGKSTWYDANEFCSDKNFTFASFNDRDSDEILTQMKLELGAYEKVWIGLRKAEYKREISKSVYVNMDKFRWAKGGPCICPSKMCVILKQGRWEPEYCSASHRFPCLTPSGDERTRQSSSNVPSVVAGIFVVILLSIIAVLVVLFILRRYNKLPTCIQGSQASDDTDSRRWGMQIFDCTQVTSCFTGMCRRGPDEDMVNERLFSTIPLTKPAVNIRDKWLKPNKVGKSNPRILLIGLPGTGKSSLINSLFAALNQDGNRNWCTAGSFGEHGAAGESAITTELRSFKLYQDLERETEEHEELKYGCRPILVDCPGLMDDASLKTKKVLSLVVGGSLPEKTNINELLMKEDQGNQVGSSSGGPLCADIIIFVHAANADVIPENLIKATRDVARDNGGIPIIVVVNKVDKVPDEAKHVPIANDIAKKFGLLNTKALVALVSAYSADTNREDARRVKVIDTYMCELWMKILDKIKVH